MVTETLTLEQVQRAVLEATRECPQVNPEGGHSGRDLIGHGRARWVCDPCSGTGRVLLFPKAGEECPHSVVVNSWDDWHRADDDGPSHWGHLRTNRDRSVDHRCSSCGGTKVIPTRDIGRLLEAYTAIKPLAMLGRESSILWMLYDCDLNALASGKTIQEALWRAMYAVVEAYHA